MGVIVRIASSSTDAAYDSVFKQHWQDVFRYALAWTNDWAAAEDLAQESFSRLWQHRRTVDWGRPLLPWLMVTTRRLATDRFRRLQRRVLGTPSATSLDETVMGRWLDVQAAMSRLSPLERTALVLTAIEGHSYADSAEVLDISAGAVRAAVSRARSKLAEA
jgi:RNA polymerase sigma-70 factor (ECF subfamily)